MRCGHASSLACDPCRRLGRRAQSYARSAWRSNYRAALAARCLAQQRCSDSSIHSSGKVRTAAKGARVPGFPAACSTVGGAGALPHR